MVRSTVLFVLVLAATPAATYTELQRLAERRASGVEALLEEVRRAFVFIGGGSGVVIHPSGLVLTNDHVAGESGRWSVRVDGRLLEADLVGTDPVGDLALLRLDGPGPFTYVQLGRSADLAIGDPVIAVGNPFGVAGRSGDPTVTFGLVTALNRFQDSYSDAIQTDAALNPGNSGGPLLDRHGRLVGINGRIDPRHGARANTGIGLAIPVDQIKRFLPLLAQARGQGVYHGVLRGLELDEEEADGIKDGAEVTSVAEDSEAERAGLQVGDRIIAIDGAPVPNAARFRGLLGTYPGMSWVELAVRGADAGERALGVVLQPLVPAAFAAEFRNEAGGRMVYVDKLTPGGAAERAGMQVGDRLVAVDGQPILHRVYLMVLLGTHLYLAGDRVPVVVERGGESVELQLTFDAAF